MKSVFSRLLFATGVLSAHCFAQNALFSTDWLVPKNPAVHIAAAAAAALPSIDRGPRANEVDVKDCPYDTTHAEECRVHWRPMLLSSAAFLAFENAGNVYTSFWYRYETVHGKWWNRYVNSVEGWNWNKWSDGNPVLDVWVGHPMMGAITNNIWIQNDPKGMTLEFSNTWPYWRSRLRALAWSTFYSFEWKLGPIGEASIGHNGDHDISQNHVFIGNNTGDVELVTTPLGGLGWSVLEDVVDEHVIKGLEEKSRNPFLLLTYQFLNPARATANIFRWRAPWYRDTREVRSSSHWSDPDEADNVIGAASPKADDYTGWGGVHEFGAIWGYSPTSGPIWGYRKDVRYMPVVIRYSYLLKKHDRWALRYSPEITALSMLDEANFNVLKLPKNQRVFNLRRRTYGAGVSPEGFQLTFAPNHRVQPFLENDGGFIYYDDVVLSPQGSQFMYTIDFGGGVNIFTKHYEAVTFGFRYDHLSNANISQHNPGTDAQIFYVGFSRFHGPLSH